MIWSLLLGVLISAVCGIVVVYQINFGQLIAALQSVHSLWLVIALVIILTTFLLRAWRWQILLRPVKPLRILPLFSAIAIGFMANMLLPAHAGEVVRAYVLGYKEQVSTAACFATIVVERLLDLVSVLLILVLTLLCARLPPEMVLLANSLKIGGYVSAFLCLTLVAGMWFLRSYTASTIRLLHVCLAFLPASWVERFTDMLQAFSLGLGTIQQGGQLVLMLGQSLVLWTVTASSNAFILRAFDLHLPISAAFLLLVLQVLGVAIPSSPGFIGTFHAAVVVGLTVFAVSRELALSVALVMHAAFFFPSILLGLVFLWHDKFSLRALWTLRATSTVGHRE